MSTPAGYVRLNRPAAPRPTNTALKFGSGGSSGGGYVRLSQPVAPRPRAAAPSAAPSGSMLKFGSNSSVNRTEPAPAPRGLFRQLGDAFTNIPAGVGGLLKEVAGTVTGAGRATIDLGQLALGQRDGNALYENFSDGVQLDDFGRLTREYAPLASSMQTSFRNSGNRVLNPTQYLTAIREGNIVDTIVEDVGNVALIAGGVGGALGKVSAVSGAAPGSTTLAAARAGGATGGRSLRTLVPRSGATQGTLGGVTRPLSAGTRVPPRLTPAQVKMPSDVTLKVPGVRTPRVLEYVKGTEPAMSNLLPGGASPIRTPGRGLAGRVERASNPTMDWRIDPSASAQRIADTGARARSLSMSAQWLDPADALLTGAARVGARVARSDIARRVGFGPFMSRIAADTRPTGPGNLDEASGRVTSKIQKARTYLLHVRGGMDARATLDAAATEGTRAGVTADVYVRSQLHKAGFTPEQIDLYGNTAMALVDRQLDTHLRGLQAMRNDPAIPQATIDATLARINRERTAGMTDIRMEHLDALAEYESGKIDPVVKQAIDEAVVRLTDNSGQRGVAGRASGDLSIDMFSNPVRTSDGVPFVQLSDDARRAASAEGNVTYPVMRDVLAVEQARLNKLVADGEITLAQAQADFATELKRLETIEASRVALGAPGTDIPYEQQAQRAFDRMAELRYRRDLAKTKLDDLNADPPPGVDIADLESRRAAQKQIVEVLNEEVADLATVLSQTREQLRAASRRRKPARVRNADIADDGAWIRDHGETLQQRMHAEALTEHDRVFMGETPVLDEPPTVRQTRENSGVPNAAGIYDTLAQGAPIWANRGLRNWYYSQGWFADGGGITKSTKKKVAQRRADGMRPDEFADMVRSHNPRMASWTDEQVFIAYLDSVDRIYATKRKAAMNDVLVESVAVELGIDIEMAHAALRGSRPFKSYMREVANAQALEIKTAFDALDPETQVRVLTDLDTVLATAELGDGAARAQVFYEALEDHFAEARDSGFDIPAERDLFEHVVANFDAADIRTMLDTGQLAEVALKRAETATVVAESKRQIAEAVIADLDAQIAGARNDAIAERSIADVANDPAMSSPYVDRVPPGEYVDTGSGVFDSLGSHVDPDYPSRPAGTIEPRLAEHMERGNAPDGEVTRPDGETVRLNATPDGMHAGGTHNTPILNADIERQLGPPIDGTVPAMTNAQAISVAEGRAMERVNQARIVRDNARRDLARAKRAARNMERDLRRSVQDDIRKIGTRGINDMRTVIRTTSAERLGGYVPASELSGARLTGLTGDLAAKHGLYNKVLDGVQRGRGRGGTLDPAAVVLQELLDERVARGKPGLDLDAGRWNTAVVVEELLAALDQIDPNDGLLAYRAAFDTVTARLNRMPDALRAEFGTDFDTALNTAVSEAQRKILNAVAREADVQMMSVPARYRRPLMEARIGVESYIKQSIAEFEAGNADTAFALARLVEDFPTSIAMYVDANLPTPEHLIGGQINTGNGTRRVDRSLAVPDTRMSHAQKTPFRVNTLSEYGRIEAQEMANIATRVGIQHLATDPTLSASMTDIIGDLIEERRLSTPEARLTWPEMRKMLNERGYDIVKGATNDTRGRTGTPQTIRFAEQPIVVSVDAAGNSRTGAYLGDGRIVDLESPEFITELPNVRVMPTKLARELSDYLDPTSNAALLMYDQVQQLWKTSTLAFSPAWITYNAIGNALMEGFSYGMSPGRMVQNMRILREAIRQENIGLGETSKAPLRTGFRSGALSNLRPGEIAAHGLTRMERQSMMGGPLDSQTRLGKALDWIGNPDRSRTGKFVEFMYSLNEFTDDLFRTSVFMEDLHTRLAKEAPIPRDLLDANGNIKRNLTPEQTAQLTQVSAAAKRAQDQAVRAALNTMGDFTRMTKFERNYVKRVMPFYPWIRHVTAMTMRMPFTNPMRWAWMASLHNTFNDEGDGPNERGLLGLLMAGPGGTMISLSAAVPFSPGITPFGSGESPEFSAFDPRSLLRAVSPLVKFPAEAITGFDVDGGGTVSRPMDQKEATGSFGETLNPSSLSRIVGGAVTGDFSTARRGLGELAYNALGQVSQTRGLRDFALGAVEGNRIRYDSGDAIDYLEPRTDTLPMRLGSALRIPFTPRDYEFQLEVARQKDADAARAARRSLARAARGG